MTPTWATPRSSRRCRCSFCFVMAMTGGCRRSWLAGQQILRAHYFDLNHGLLIYINIGQNYPKSSQIELKSTIQQVVAAQLGYRMPMFYGRPAHELQEQTTFPESMKVLQGCKRGIQFGSRSPERCWRTMHTLHFTRVITRACVASIYFPFFQFYFSTRGYVPSLPWANHFFPFISPYLPYLISGQLQPLAIYRIKFICLKCLSRKSYAESCANKFCV